VSGTFVTGGTGFLGGAILDRLRREPDLGPVKALARTRTGGELLAAAGAEPVIGSIDDPAALRAGMEACDRVFHVAGLNAMCLRDPTPLFETNVTGSVNVVEAAAAAGVSRVVYTSSAATIGEEQGTVGSETSPHRGSYLSAYERSKHEGEVAAFAAAEAAGVEVVSVNPSSVQGPGRAGGSTKILIGYLNGKLRATVDTRLSIVDIADCTEGHLAALAKGKAGERYILSGATATVDEALALLAEITGVRRRVVRLPRWAAMGAGRMASVAAQVRRTESPMCRDMVRTLLHGHRYDGSRAERELGISYLPLAATLSRTVDWLADFGFVNAGVLR
jgi:dihydroflavonol-4-reductase